MCGVVANLLSHRGRILEVCYGDVDQYLNRSRSRSR